MLFIPQLLIHLVVTNQDFVTGLSVLVRGSFHEKLQWAFRLYDVNGDGYITKDEMNVIVSSVYELLGKLVSPVIEESTAKDHVERVFTVSTNNFL